MKIGTRIRIIIGIILIIIGISYWFIFPGDIVSNLLFFAILSAWILFFFSTVGATSFLLGFLIFIYGWGGIYLRCLWTDFCPPDTMHGFNNILLISGLIFILFGVAVGLIEGVNKFKKLLKNK